MANITANCTGIIPPPLGVTPNFVNPPSLLKSHIAIHTVFLGLDTLCLAMRLYTRKFIQRKLALDDCEFWALVTLFYELLLMTSRCYNVCLCKHILPNNALRDKYIARFQIYVRLRGTSRSNSGGDLLTATVLWDCLQFEPCQSLNVAVPRGILCFDEHNLPFNSDLISK